MDWFILRVAGRQAERVVATIGEANCWRPMEKHWTKPARKHMPIQVERALIPGWLFVKADQIGRWDDLDGVYGTLKYGRLGVLWIEDSELDGLRSACDDPPEPPQASPESVVEKIPVGTRVKLRGLFYGRSGTLVGYTRDDFAIVDLGAMEIRVALRLIEQG